MDRAIKDASDFDLQVSQIKVTGNNATAQVRQGDDGETAEFSFVKEGDAWKASALGGAVLKRASRMRGAGSKRSPLTRWISVPTE